MAVSTIDTRHHVMGDMLLITGTFDLESDNAVAITLPDISVVFASGAMADLGGAQTGDGTDGCFPTHTGAGGLQVEGVANMTGRWWVLGKR